MPAVMQPRLAKLPAFRRWQLEHPQRLIESFDLCVDRFQFFREVRQAGQIGLNTLLTLDELNMRFLKQIERRVRSRRN